MSAGRLSIFLFAGLLLGQTSTPATREAQALWATMLDAMGGGDQLSAVHSMLQTDDQKLFAVKPGLRDTQTHLVRLFVFPDREWQWADEGSTVLGLSLEVFNLRFGFGYWAQPGSPPKLLDVVEGGADQIWQAQLIYLHEAIGCHPEPIRVFREQGAPRARQVIETKLLDSPVHGTGTRYFRADFTINDRTHLADRIMVYSALGRGAGVSRRKFELSRYRRVEQIMIPGRVISSFVYDGKPDFPIEENFRIQLNVPFREEVFERQPSIDEGPYAWRPQYPFRRCCLTPE